MKLRARGPNGQSPSSPPERLIAGLFTVTSAEQTSPGALVPGVAEIDDERFVGAWPGPADSDALEGVTTDLDARTPWSQWIAASHVVASFGGAVALTEVERALDANLGALQAVCRAPRMLLRHEEERDAVSRARRISSRTIADLVSRPSDWEHRTLRSIRPARVLAVVPEDDWNLYENRVAARLIDRLRALLSRRLDDLGRVRALLEEGHDFSDETRGSHWRIKRLERAWSRVERDEALRERVAKTYRKVMALRDAVYVLVASPLYANVPRGAQVDDALRPTNILLNDPSYRKVAELWRVVARARFERTPSREELVARRRAVSARFDTFAAMLTLKALASLGYQPESDAPLGDRPLAIHGPRGALSLQRLADGGLTITQGARTLSILALPVDATAEDAASIWSMLRTMASRDTLFLLHGRPDATLSREGIEPVVRAALAGWSWPRVLLVSPWSLDAIERVERVIGAWDAQGRLAQFPPRIAWKGATPEGMPTWARATSGHLAVTQPVSESERANFEGALRQREALLARSRSAPQREREAQHIEALRTLLSASNELRWLSRCPVCEGRRVRFEDRWQEGASIERQTIWCHCDGCDAEWGLNACGTCQRRYEALDAGVNLPMPDDVAKIDRTWGRDVWTRPTVSSERRVFRCPACANL